GVLVQHVTRDDLEVVVLAVWLQRHRWRGLVRERQRGNLGARRVVDVDVPADADRQTALQARSVVVGRRVRLAEARLAVVAWKRSLDVRSQRTRLTRAAMAEIGRVA